MGRYLSLSIALLLLLASCRDETSIIGDQYYEAGEYEKAIQQYNEYLKLKPRHIKSIYNRGRAYAQIGEYDLAVEDYLKVLKLEPKYASALVSLGIDYYRKGDFDNAAYYSSLAAEYEPDNAQVQLHYGMALHRLGKTDEALSAYGKAIRLNSSLGEAFYYRGALRLVLNQRRAACSDFEAARRLGVAEAEEAISKQCR